MNIAAVQVPQQVSKSQNSKETKVDDFSKVLSKVTNKEVVNSSKKESKNLESKEENEDTEVDKDKVDIIAGMLNMNLFEKIEPMITLDGQSNILVDNSTVSIEIAPNMNINTDGISTEDIILGQANFETIIDVNPSIATFGEEINKAMIENDSTEVNLIDTNINTDRLIEEELIPTHKDNFSFEEFRNEPSDKVKNYNPNKELLNKEISDISISNEEVAQKIDSIDIKNIPTIKLESEEKIIVKEHKEVNIIDGTHLKNSNKVESNTTVVPKEAVLSSDNLQNVNDTIIQLMETTSEGDTNVINVKLNPEELGAVDVTLKMEGGKLTAKISVENEFVKGLFDSKVNQLNESLAKQNIHLEKINIDLNLNSNSSNNSGFDLNQNGGFNQGRENNSKRNYFGTTNTDHVNSNIQDNNNIGTGKLSILA